MANGESVTLLYARADRQKGWENVGTTSKVIRVNNFNVLVAAIAIAVSDKAGDVRQVIFDGTIGSDTYLQFLSALPSDFLGDVLAMFEDGSAYLSATARQGGRVMYRLEPADIEFYLDIHFRMFAAVPIRERMAPLQSFALAS